MILGGDAPASHEESHGSRQQRRHQAEQPQLVLRSVQEIGCGICCGGLGAQVCGGVLLEEGQHHLTRHQLPEYAGGVRRVTCDV